MNPKCITAVIKAIGRKLTKPELDGIEQRLTRHMRNLARQEPIAALAKSPADRLHEAAQSAAQELVGEAQLKQQRTAQTIVAHARIQQYLDDAGTRGIKGLDALDNVMSFNADYKANFTSVESQINANRDIAISSMLRTIEAAHPKFLGLFANKEAEQLVWRELYGEDTGNADAKAGAKEFQAIAEKYRQRFNRGGGNIGHLEDWSKPQSWSQHLVAKAGRKQFIDDFLPELSGEYFNEDGTRMSQAQLGDFLGHAFTTIATGGANKLEAGQFKGTAARANRGNQSRQIHLKNADAAIKLAEKYSDKSLFDSLIGHVEGIAKDISLVETLGPNPDATFRFFRDKVVKEGKLADPVNSPKLDELAVKSENLYNLIAGKTLPLASARLANSFDTARNWLISSRLGSSVITSFSDEATLYMTAKLNNLPEMQLLKNELATYNKFNATEERLANRAGLGLRTTVASLNRFGEVGLRSGFSRALANTTLRASGLLAMTEARHRAFGVTMMSSIGQVTKDHGTLKDLDVHDNRILLSKGITETDFAVWKQAKLEDWDHGNNTMLTPESIYRIPDATLAKLGDPVQLREQAATKLLAAILEETDVAVIEPGARERLMTGAGLQRGTWKGEITRSFFLFKSFPLAMVNRHFVRGMSMPNRGGRAAYLATLIAATTVLGAASLEVNEVLSGRDPKSLDPTAKGGTRNWIAALLKGGSMGLYGDFLFSDSTQYGNSPIATFTGPVMEFAEDAFNLTQGNIVQALQGKNTNLGAEAVRFVRSNLPGANLWYAKAALDHLVFHQLQEYFSPGYLAKMRSRAEREFNQKYWWEPGQVAPDRAPDFGAIAGEN